MANGNALLGILNVDKPLGMTSHDVVDVVRRLVHMRRVGHAGTLDPLATGVLVICLGKATRLSEYVMGGSKEYRAHIRFGTVTDTYDAEGRIVSQHSIDDLSRTAIEEALADFRGDIGQVPPMYSALKCAGKPLYELARKGVTVERPARPVTIHELEILSWNCPDLQLRIVCSKGTYVRTLAHDLGQSVGVGGFLSALRRWRVGSFELAEAVTVAELEARPEDWKKWLIPPAVALADKPQVQVDAETARCIGYGQSVALDIGSQGDVCFAYDDQWRLVAAMVPTDQDGVWRPDKVFV